MKTFVALFSVIAAVSASSELLENAYTLSIHTGRHLVAHGCAVNGVVLTNAHVVDLRAKDEVDRVPPKVYFRYEFGPNKGVGNSYGVSNLVDIAVIQLDQDPPYGFATLASRPEEGDKIHWFEFDYRKRKNVGKERRREGKIVNIAAGFVHLDENATRGSSGSCAYNKDGQVIGLITFGTSTGDGKGSAGIAGLWGSWWGDVPSSDE
jgi:hypothetical protein